MPFATLVRKANEDSPPVDIAQRAAHEPVALEPADHPRQGALTQVGRASQILDPGHLLPLFDQPVEDFELTDAESVGLERPLKGPCRPRVAIQ